MNWRKISNRFCLLQDYLARKSFVSGMPAALCVEVTNRCNMSCVMCPRENLPGPDQDMSFSLFKRIIDEVKGFTEFVDFSFRGESLLNKNVFQMIAYARSCGMRTSMQSNGVLLSEENCRALLNAGLDLLTISIDAFLPETYAKIRMGGDFAVVLKNTKRMIALNNEKHRPMTIVVQMIGMKDNCAEFKSFKAYWKKEKGVFAKIKPFSSRAGLVEDRGIVSKRGKETRCSRIWKDMRICANGVVVPCCNDFQCRNPLGDLRIQSVKEVWNSESFVCLRKNHGSGAFEKTSICHHCEFLQTDFYKQLVTFIFDDLSIRQMMAVIDPKY